MKSKIPLLITSYINAGQSSTVNLKDPNTRLSLTIEGISHWLKLNPSLNIVICDGSNSDQSILIKQLFPNSQIEWVYFQNNHTLVEKYGKGFGEGEIIEYALNHSTILRFNDCFMKCTGKLWVPNYREMLEDFKSPFLAKGFFNNVLNLRPTQFEYIDTRFFITTKNFFFEHIHPAYLLSKNYSVELALKDELLKKNLSNFLFNRPIIIEGVGGGIGMAYKNNMRRYLKEIIRNFLLARSKFKNLFVN
jgi:hypothetical protein